MNHRKLIPANGMSLAANSILALPVSSHCEPGEPPSGSDVRIRIMRRAEQQGEQHAGKGRGPRGGQCLEQSWSDFRPRVMVTDVRADRAADAPSGRELRRAASRPGRSSRPLTNALRPSARSSQPRTVSGTSIGCDVAVVDVQEGGAADRAAGGVDDHAEHRVEHQRQHTAVHGVVAADVEPAELHAATRRRRRRTSSRGRAPSAGCRAGQAGHPVGRARHLRPPRTGPAAPTSSSTRSAAASQVSRSGSADTAKSCTRRIAVEEPAESRARVGGLELREAAVPVVVGVDVRVSAALAHARHHRAAARTSRRTMVWSRPGPTPMHETCAPASSSSRST